MAFVPADEDYGLITLEAMACGTPVVTCTDSGGPTELISHGVNGLVTGADPGRARSAALAALAAEPGRARKMGVGPPATAPSTSRGPRTVATVLDSPSTGRTAAGARDRSHQEARSSPRRRRSPARHARPKVVVLSTFRDLPPRHGGQLRCLHLYGAWLGTPTSRS